MDVVPVYENLWTHAPFGAEIDETGKIFARGTQDMKSVGMQYLGAINSLKNQGIRLKRTLHVIYVPGMLKVTFLFLKFHNLNITVFNLTR